jgi:hypothetical protein
VQLKKDDGSLVNPAIKTSKCWISYLVILILVATLANLSWNG